MDRVVCVTVIVVSAGCGPVISPAGEGGTSSGTGSTVTTWSEQSLTGEASEAGESSSSSSSTGSVECEALPEVPIEPEATWCTGDPYSLPPLASRYVSCVDGFVDFGQSWASTGFLFYDASAQFYSVRDDTTGGLYGVALDPYDGSLDDCALYDGSNDGHYGAVEFEDAGDVTFAFDDVELTAGVSGGVDLINYFANAAEQGIAPRFLAPHGLTATGGATPPIDLSTAVTLPDPIVVTAPATDGTALVDIDAFTLEWEPSALGVPLDLTILFAPDDEPELALFCRMDDDGSFTVPSALACHLPRPTSVSLILLRADTRLVDTDDGRSIVVTASTRMTGSVTLQ